MKKIIPIVIFIMLFSISCFAHSGRTDSNGGHYDTSTGEYHYHNDGTTSYENELIIEDDNSSGWYEYKINRLNNSLESKQNTIDELNTEIEKLHQEIEENEFWKYIYIAIIIGLIIYILYKK